MTNLYYAEANFWQQQYLDKVGDRFFELLIDFLNKRLESKTGKQDWKARLQGKTKRLHKARLHKARLHKGKTAQGKTTQGTEGNAM